MRTKRAGHSAGKDTGARGPPPSYPRNSNAGSSSIPSTIARSNR
jgi:hypothetical protein